MRSIHKKNFGVAPSPKLRVTANLGAGNETCAIVKQNSGKSFTLVSIAVPTRIMSRVQLVQGTPAAVGQMQLIATPFGGTAKSVKNIQSRILHTFEDNGTYTWVLGATASVAGSATVTFA